MSNRLDHEFPRRDRQVVSPAIGPEQMEVYLRRARQIRRDVTRQAIRTGAGWIAEGVRRLAAVVVPAAGRLGAFLRCASYGAAKRRPERAGLAVGCD